jgi:hypothetical protein
MTKAHDKARTNHQQAQVNIVEAPPRSGTFRGFYALSVLKDILVDLPKEHEPYVQRCLRAAFAFVHRMKARIVPGAGKRDVELWIQRLEPSPSPEIPPLEDLRPLTGIPAACFTIYRAAMEVDRIGPVLNGSIPWTLFYSTITSLVSNKPKNLDSGAKQAELQIGRVFAESDDKDYAGFRADIFTPQTPVVSKTLTTFPRVVLSEALSDMTEADSTRVKRFSASRKPAGRIFVLRTDPDTPLFYTCLIWNAVAKMVRRVLWHYNIQFCVVPVIPPSLSAGMVYGVLVISPSDLAICVTCMYMELAANDPSNLADHLHKAMAIITRLDSESDKSAKTDPVYRYVEILRDWVLVTHNLSCGCDGQIYTERQHEQMLVSLPISVHPWSEQAAPSALGLMRIANRDDDPRYLGNPHFVRWALFRFFPKLSRNDAEFF